MFYLELEHFPLLYPLRFTLIAGNTLGSPPPQGRVCNQKICRKSVEPSSLLVGADCRVESSANTSPQPRVKPSGLDTASRKIFTKTSEFMNWLGRTGDNGMYWRHLDGLETLGRTRDTGTYWRHWDVLETLGRTGDTGMDWKHCDRLETLGLADETET